MEFDLENPLPPSKDKFPSLFEMESDHVPSNTKAYVRSLDSCISVRRGIITSILHFSRDFDPFLSYLAINYMDRFLSVHSIPDGKLWIFKLVGISCISLAMKMRKTEYSVSDLMVEGGFVFDPAAIERTETMILNALKWRMRSVNPFCFFDYFISFFNLRDYPSVQALKDRATGIMLKAQHDIKLLEFKPSIVSASALLCAANDICPIQFPSFRNAVCTCSYVDKEDFLRCYVLMQDVANEAMRVMASGSCTPVNVLDLNCFSSSFSGSQGNQRIDTENNGGED